MMSIKTGKYMPEEAERAYPWDRGHMILLNTKNCCLCLGKTAPGFMTPLDDEVAFHTCLKTLARGRGTGPATKWQTKSCKPYQRMANKHCTT